MNKVNIILSVLLSVGILTAVTFIIKNERRKDGGGNVHEKNTEGIIPKEPVECSLGVNPNINGKRIIPHMTGLKYISGMNPGKILAYRLNDNMTLFVVADSEGNTYLSRDQKPFPIDCIKNKVEVLILDEKLNPIQSNQNLTAHFLDCKTACDNREQTYVCDNLYKNHPATLIIRDGVVGFKQN